MLFWCNRIIAENDINWDFWKFRFGLGELHFENKQTNRAELKKSVDIFNIILIFLVKSSWKKQHGKGKHMSETRNDCRPYARNGIDKSAHMHMVYDVDSETAS